MFTLKDTSIGVVPLSIDTGIVCVVRSTFTDPTDAAAVDAVAGNPDTIGRLAAYGRAVGNGFMGGEERDYRGLGACSRRKEKKRQKQGARREGKT